MTDRTDDLAERLRAVAAELEEGINFAHASLAARPGIVSPYLAVDPNGRFLMLDALTAQANVLAALAALEAR